MLIKGIIIFPTLFTPKIAKGATEPKYGGTLLIPPNDPQLPMIQAAVAEAQANGYPSGMPAGTDCCFQPYDVKYQGKDYYDPRFSGWWALSSSAKADDRPAVVSGSEHAGFENIIDPGAVFSGCVVSANIGITHYAKGKGGIGGWLNGVLYNGEESQFGRLDGKPTVDQMFSGTGAAAPAVPGPVAPAAPAAPAAPPAPPAAPAAPPAPPAAPVHTMTAKANGVTYEQYMATPGWTDELLIRDGLMLSPGGVPTQF